MRSACAQHCAASSYSPPAAVAEATRAIAEVLEVVKREPDLVRQIDVELRCRDLKLGATCIAGSPAEDALAMHHRPSHSAHRWRAAHFDAQGRKLGQLGGARDTVLFARGKYFRMNISLPLGSLIGGDP